MAESVRSLHRFHVEQLLEFLNFDRQQHQRDILVVLIKNVFSQIKDSPLSLKSHSIQGH
jgi:hypothetical protein